ncbi:dermonecrotic toxin domain-containing protein [Pseudomonas sp. Irchel 3F5]|uniref:dermonecrotic toxin domain-containing protein n=1 Tax=Pseudomonas sp. Irchel 3F5 TaxID=2009002 RepID=UPI000BA373DE|nr:DUF6543 domain-containing protein [Pseudomonas sp. Irchel 3F5]
MTDDTLKTLKSHDTFFHGQIPNWIKHSSTYAIEELHQRQLPASQPPADTDVSLREALTTSRRRSQASSTAAATVLRGLKGISEFAEPLLVAEIKRRFKLDVDTTANEFVHMRNDASLREDRLDAVLISRQSLLQAALQNFAVADVDAFHADAYSALAPLDALQAFPATVDPERRAHQSIRYTSKLSISTRDFAEMCRELDLGQRYQDHLQSVLDAPATRDSVRQALTAAARDLSKAQVDAARVAGHISEPAYRMLKKLLAQSATARAGQTLQVAKVYDDGTRVSFFDDSACYQLNLFGTTLGGGLVLISPDPDTAQLPVPLVVFMPGDAKPVQEFYSYVEFYDDLKERLQNKDFRRFFSRFLPRRGQAQIVAKLTSNSSWLAQRPQAMAVRGELYNYLYDLMLVRAKDDAAVLAVPTHAVDRDAWRTELEHYFELGLSMLNVGAFFAPGLGEVMLVVMGAEFVAELFHGVQAWEANDKEQALDYLKSFCVNLAITAGLGVVAGRVATELHQPLAVDALQAVELPNGQIRLWRPDLAPYDCGAEILQEQSADARGVYSVGSKTYIRVDGKTLQIAKDANLDKWRVEHPDDPQAYRPPLEHNGQGSWHHSLERPDTWSRTTLVRRLGHRFEGWPDELLERMADVSGVSETELRRVYSDDQPLPIQLADTLNRFEVDRLITTQISKVRSGQGLQSGFSYPVALLPELPGWPVGRAIELYSSAEYWGVPSVYGTPAQGVAAIKLSRDDLLNGRLLGKVIQTLNHMELTTWFGGDYRVRGQTELGAQLADHMLMSRMRIFASVSNGMEGVSDPLQIALQRDFPGLSRPVAQSLAEAADASQRSRWQTSQRVPLRLAERAREASRRVRLSRTCEGFEFSYLASDDTYTLALRLLAQMPGWTNTVHLSVRTGSEAGNEIVSIGRADARVRKTLVRTSQGWRAFDEQGETLGSINRDDHGFFNSLLQALPDSERVALGLHIGDNAALRRVLLKQVAQQPAKARLALGMAVDPVGFRRPLQVGAGRRGYPLGGVVGRLLPRTHEQRLRSLFPDYSEVQLRNFFRNVDLQGESLQSVIGDLEQELETERQGLSAWVDQGASATVRERRRQLATQLLDVWQLRRRAPLEVSEYHLDEAPGYRLTLSLPQVDALPPLTSEIDQILELELHYMPAIRELPSTFLRAFPNLRRLSVRSTPLIELPENLAQLSELQVLVLDHTRTGLANLQRLSGLAHLHLLELRDVSPSPALVSAAQMAPLRQLPALHVLSLMDNQVSFGPGVFAELAQLPDLRELYLFHNNITLSEADVTQLAGLTTLRELSLGRNPLRLSPDISRMPALRLLLLNEAQLTTWPVGLLTTSPMEVRLDGNVITEVPVGAGLMRGLSFGYQNMSEDLTTRLIRERMQVQPEPGADVLMENMEYGDTDDDDLSAYQQLTVAQRQTALDLFQLHGSRPLRRLLARLLNNRQITEAQAVRMIEAAAAEPEGVGEQLFSQADNAETCEDRDIVVFSDMQGLQEAHQALGQLAQAQGDEASRQLLALGISRWRLQRLRTYVAAQIRGWHADQDFREFIDDVEVELYFRIHLADRLRLRNQPTAMEYDQTVSWVTNAMLAEAARVIREDQTGLLPEWMTNEVYWQAYLKRVYKARFAALSFQLAALFDPAIEFMDELKRLRGSQPDLTMALPAVEGETARQLALAFGVTQSELSQLAYDEASWIQAYRKLQDAREAKENELPGILTREEIGRNAG